MLAQVKGAKERFERDFLQPAVVAAILFFFSLSLEQTEFISLHFRRRQKRTRGPFWKVKRLLCDPNAPFSAVIARPFALFDKKRKRARQKMFWFQCPDIFKAPFLLFMTAEIRKMGKRSRETPDIGVSEMALIFSFCSVSSFLSRGCTEKE